MATQDRTATLAPLGAPGTAALAEIRASSDEELLDAIRTRPALYANACLDELVARDRTDPDPHRHAYDDAGAHVAAFVAVGAALAVAAVLAALL